MGIKDDLESEIENIYKKKWSRRKGRVVPEDDNIKLGNDGIDLEITMLYADLSASTRLVDNYKDWFAAENYKAFLRCAAKIIRAEGGRIRAYDGERIKGVFIGIQKKHLQ